MTADPLTFDDRPALRRPVLILAFAGWSDAGASATTAVRYLSEQLMAVKFAAIDPEEFYDFSIQRPQVRLVDGLRREIHWPTYDFHYGIGIERDFAFGVGAEPHLRWRGVSPSILRPAPDSQIEPGVTIGPYLPGGAYTPPVPR